MNVADLTDAQVRQLVYVDWNCNGEAFSRSAVTVETWRRLSSRQKRVHAKARGVASARADRTLRADPAARITRAKALGALLP